MSSVSSSKSRGTENRQRKPKQDSQSILDGDLSPDTAFEILRNRRRRHVLLYLASMDEQTAIGDLSEHIAAIENDVDTAALDSQQRKRVYIALYQCHLPKMDDAGVIRYDRRRGEIALAPRADPLLDSLDTNANRVDSQESTATRNRIVLGVTVGIVYGVGLLLNVGPAVSLVVFLFLIWFCVESVLD